MKKYIVILLFFFAHILAAQNTESSNNVDSNIYNAKAVDKQPEYPGGLAEFDNFIKANFRKPETNQGMSGKIVAMIVVHIDGSISDMKILRDFGSGSGKETIRLLRMTSNWIPAEKDGKKVNTKMLLTLNIN